MVTLHKVDHKNVWKLLRLKVAEEQEDYVASNTQSIVEAYTTVAAGGVALPFGIYDGETPVGFLMIGYDAIPGVDGPAIEKGNYSIWRLMIDRDQQGKGYGRQAMQLALDYICTFPCGKAELCFLSYEPENKAAAALYHSFGFRETGEFDEDEVIAALRL